MNLSELKRAIDKLEPHWVDRVDGSSYTAFDAKKVLRLLSKVTLEDVMAEVKGELREGKG